MHALVRVTSAQMSITQRERGRERGRGVGQEALAGRPAVQDNGGFGTHIAKKQDDLKKKKKV